MKLATLLQGAALTVVGLASASLGFMVTDRTPPVYSIRSLTNTHLKAGDTGAIYTVVHRDRVCKTTMSEFVFDGQNARTVLEPMTHEGGVGPLGKDIYIHTFPVPYKSAPGIGRYRMVLTYVCNPLHEVWPIVVTLPDLFFNIEPSN